MRDGQRMNELPTLFAEAAIPLGAPSEMLARLARHCEEHARVTVQEQRTIIETNFGRAEILAEQGILRIRAQSDTEVALSVVKMALADHLFALAGEDKPSFAWTGHDAARPDLPYFRTMRVQRSIQVTPRMRRVILAGETDRLDIGGLHVRVLIPPSGRRPCWPHAAPDGRTIWPVGDDALTARVYTIRRIDAERGEIALDVVVHPGHQAPGSRWACTARPGDPVGLMGPGGGPLPAARWYLFAGDETALPAISRMLEELPGSARAIVRIEVADPGEEQPIRSLAKLDVRWLHRGGLAAGSTSLLEDAIADIEWPNDREQLHVWIGCEQATARIMRKRLGEAGIDKKQHTVAAYWRRSDDEDDAG